VDLRNAFIGKTKQPTTDEISSALRQTAGLWNELLAWLGEQGVTTQEWKSYSVKHGWSLQVKLKKRTIVHLAVYTDCFLVAFILGDRAVKAALAAKLPARVVKAIKEVPRYAEGTGVRLVVKRTADLAAIRKLALVKLAN